MLHLARRIYSSTTIVLKELLPSPPPPRRRQRTGSSGMSVSFAGAELTRSERQLGLPPRGSAAPLSRPFTVCVLPLCFGHTQSRCCLSGAHCHSISTTRLSFIGQAETLAASQSGVRLHATQPIAAVVHLNWQPMRPIAIVAYHNRRLLTNRMCTACR